MNIKKLYLTPGTTFEARSGQNPPGVNALKLVDDAFEALTGLRLPLSCCSTTQPTNGQALIWNSVTQKLEFTTLSGGGAGTNLSGTPSATNIVLSSSTGSSYTIPLATTTLAGLLSPVDKVKLNALTNTNTGDVTVTDSGSIDFTLTGQALTGVLSGITAATIGFVPTKGVGDTIVWTAVSGGGSGTVTSVGFTNANGFTGTIATATTTPTLTLGTSITGLLKGNGSAISAAVAGTDYVAPNVAITAGTGTKVTYDTKGLVTSSTNATATDIVNTPSGNLAGTTVQAALNELQGDIDTLGTNSTALVTLSGVTAGSTNLGTFTGTTIADNLTNKAALQSVETALEGKLVGTQVFLNGLASTQATTTQTADGQFKLSNLNLLNFLGSTGIVAGKEGLVPAPAITDNTKFLRGDGTWQTVSAGSAGISIQDESVLLGTALSVDTINFVGSSTATRVGNTVTVTSPQIATKYLVPLTGGSANLTIRAKATPGVTAVKTNASTITFTIPAGGYIDNYEVHYGTGELPGANTTHVFNYTTNTLTNQGLSTADAPDIKAWYDDVLPVNIFHARNIASADDFVSQIVAIGSGNITMLMDWNSGSTGLGVTPFVVKGNF